MRAPRLFEELALCHADGSFRKRLAAIAKISVLIIDDFAIAPIGPRERNDLLELLDDRVGTRACIVTSQPVSDWHDYIGDPTLADAILDRLVHRSHRIHLEASRSGGTAGHLQRNTQLQGFFPYPRHLQPHERDGISYLRKDLHCNLGESSMSSSPFRLLTLATGLAMMIGAEPGVFAQSPQLSARESDPKVLG